MKIQTLEERVFDLTRDLYHEYSNFQMLYFIICASGITLYGRWRQALRELEARYDTRRSLKRQLAVHKLEVPYLKRWVFGKLRRARRVIRLDGVEDQIIDEERRLIGNQREMIFLIQMVNKLRNELGDVSDREALERNHWAEKLTFDVILSRVSKSPPDKRLLEILNFLPEEVRKQIGSALDADVQTLQDRFKEGTLLGGRDGYHLQ